MSRRIQRGTLWREACPDLSWWHTADRKRELMSGLAGAALVIPQAITFAYLLGLAPQYGLYCAVFVALISSLFGNSPMVGGPNTAMSILLALTIAPYAGRGSPLYIDYVLLLSVMVGMIQLVFWLLRGAVIFRYLSPAAISGIKMGVGVLLITSALEGMFGVSGLSMQFFYEKFYVVLTSWGDIVNPASASISGITIVSTLLLKQRFPRSYILLAVMVGAILSALIEGWIGPLVSQVELLGNLPFDPWPLRLPYVTKEYLLVMEEVLPSAVAIATLGLAQSLVIARDLKSQITSKIDLHKEVFAQGVSNVASGFFSAFAGSGSFNRTSVAVEMGARTPLSGLVAAVAVVLMAWGLGPFLSRLPMPAIAAVLALVGMGMIQWKEIRMFLRNRVDGAVFLVTVCTVTFIGLEMGILVAVLASIAFFVASASKVRIETTKDADTERIAVRGNLFYASLDELASRLRTHPADTTILDLTRVSYCDAAAWALIAAVKAERETHGGRLQVLQAG